MMYYRFQVAYLGGIWISIYAESMAEAEEKLRNSKWGKYPVLTVTISRRVAFYNYAL